MFYAVRWPICQDVHVQAAKRLLIEVFLPQCSLLFSGSNRTSNLTNISCHYPYPSFTTTTPLVAQTSIHLLNIHALLFL
jgi:hypothetical protein